MSRSRLAGAFGALALTAALLTGCAVPAPVASTPAVPGPEPSVEETVEEPVEQSVAEACDASEVLLADVGKEMAKAAGMAAEDPESIVPLYKESADAMHAAAAQLGNAEVRVAVQNAAKALDTLTDVYGALLANPEEPDLEAFQDALGGIDTEFGAIDELCG